MKNKKIVKLLMTEGFKQRERFERLYGPGDYSRAIEQNLKRTLWLIWASIIFLGLVTIFQLNKSSLTSQGMVLDGQGNIVSINRPTTNGQTKVVKADIISGSGNKLTNESIKLMVLPQEKSGESSQTQIDNNQETPLDKTRHEIRKVLYQINEDTSSSAIRLPKKLPDGTRIHWIPAKTNNWFVLISLTILICIAIYKNRDAGLGKAEKEAKESVLRELPEFVNKLVLLLNAGLILNSAFYKIISDYNRLRGGEKSYFYGQMGQLMTKCYETNGSVQHELRVFAVRTGVVEFMRLSNIISDSMTKGSDLMAQLKMEGDSLWAARRKHLEEKGKIAETKLTFPLVILLLVLVMITIAPAMMEM